MKWLFIILQQFLDKIFSSPFGCPILYIFPGIQRNWATEIPWSDHYPTISVALPPSPQSTTPSIHPLLDPYYDTPCPIIIRFPVVYSPADGDDDDGDPGSTHSQSFNHCPATCLYHNIPVPTRSSSTRILATRKELRLLLILNTTTHHPLYRWGDFIVKSVESVGVNKNLRLLHL